ncbi:NERD domain-containing protein [Streptomyces sp. NE06-03E]|uniref:nuclease-related domain-containing protein n=1 Tax=Streptomyces sp. NE06-03E TaxID=3028695 RepID=UPI0029B3FCF3|nr:NERD domain-containing protein [Streptomyces sp. NE06-03E]MDX3055614.1 NERD domain-containing protein [Streptomyces sp. NE06-03E]
MQDLKVTSWQLFGHDRLYVNLPDGTAIGWADRGSGTITVLHPRYRDAVADALARQVPDLPALVGEDAPAGHPAPPVPPPVPRILPMRGMRKRGAGPDTAAVWNPAPPEPESGQDMAAVRKPVPPPDPERVRGPEPAPEPVAAPQRAPVPDPVAASAPAPAPASGVAEASPPAPEAVRRRRPGVLPALTPGSDLASRRPGAGLREQLGEGGTGALVRAATGALRRHKDGDPRRGALAGERRVGAELKRLTRHGWRVLHSVPLPDGAEIGHLLIGPGGVFAVRTDHRPGASVRVGDGTLRLDEGDPQPYALDGSPDARRARAALEAYCAFDVPVQTVLVFTGVTALEVVATPDGIRVCRERQLSALTPLTGVFTLTQVERIYDVARNAEAWLDV